MSLEQVEQLAVAGIINGRPSMRCWVSASASFSASPAISTTPSHLGLHSRSVCDLRSSDRGPSLLAADGRGRAHRRDHSRRRDRALGKPPLAQASGPPSLLTIFISSLGLTIAGINLISTLIWTVFSRSIDLVPVRPVAFR